MNELKFLSLLQLAGLFVNGWPEYAPRKLFIYIHLSKSCHIEKKTSPWNANSVSIIGDLDFLDYFFSLKLPLEVQAIKVISNSRDVWPHFKVFQ